MECEPGQEAQIDYGTLYLRIGENGRRKKVHVLLVTLSHSRKSYVEAVLSQHAESFLRSIENAFRHFGAKQKGSVQVFMILQSIPLRKFLATEAS